MGTTNSGPLTVGLHLLVNQATLSTMSDAIRREAQIINDVPVSLTVSTVSKNIVRLLNNILTTVIGSSFGASIRITARVYGNVTLLHIRDRNRFSDAFKNKLQEIEKLAVENGLTVNFTSYRNDVSTIAVSIINMPVAV